MSQDLEKNIKDTIQSKWISDIDLETAGPTLDMKYQGKVVRKLPFYEHLGRQNELATIIKIGGCNFNCPYCFRYTKSATHQTIPLWKLLNIGVSAISKDMIIRLSGGDPVAIRKVAIEMVKFFYQQRGNKFLHGRVAVAHNGSSPDFIDKIAPFLKRAALDIKTVPKKYTQITGITGKNRIGSLLFKNAIQSVKVAEDHGILVEIRTPVFSDTTYEDLIEIGENLENLKLDPHRTFWTLRIYNAVDTCSWDAVKEKKIYPELKRIAKQFKSLNIGLRRDTISSVASLERL